MKESVSTMGRKHANEGEVKRAGVRKVEKVLPDQVIGGGELEDEMEEVDDVDDARMEI
jgi:hypothetical protein